MRIGVARIYFQRFAVGLTSFDIFALFLQVDAFQVDFLYGF